MFQRVTGTAVHIDGKLQSATGPGALVLLAVGKNDTDKDAEYMAERIAHLRVFSCEHGKMQKSLLDVGGEVMVVSQFTLYGDVKKGRRPGFERAAPPAQGAALCERTVALLVEYGLTVKTGVFGANMQVGLVNDGPVTILLSSEKEF